jgi:XTP/dITP diphosphohydrolase
MMHATTLLPTKEFELLVTIIRRLRRECPWDRKQTHASLRSSLIEEAYEVAESVSARNTGALRSELGDLLMNIILHATIAEQKREFTLREVLDEITDKMIRRHPHVFGTTKARTTNDVLRRWEQIKLAEGRRSLLDGIPRALPALMRARRVQERAARAGFDWRRRSDVWAKVTEEVREVHGTLERGSRQRREEEFGDLLFALVNYARFLRLDPEHALQRATAKFTKRFRGIEKELARRGRNVHNSSLGEMDAIWNTLKSKEKRRR